MFGWAESPSFRLRNKLPAHVEPAYDGMRVGVCGVGCALPRRVAAQTKKAFLPAHSGARRFIYELPRDDERALVIVTAQVPDE
jgi:hypothetical protein